MNAAVGNFASRAIWGEDERFALFCSMGIFDNNELVAAVIYHNYDPDNGVVEVSAGSVSKRWMNRSVLRQFLCFPFEKLACQAVVARHDETRADLRRMWVSVGAVEHIIPRVRGRNAPAEVVSVLTDDAWYASPHMRH